MTLERESIIGHRLVEIRQAVQINHNGLDWVISYFVLDGGVAFTLPGEWANEIDAEQPPTDTVVLHHPVTHNVYGKRIIDVLRAKPDSMLSEESPYILFENSCVVTDVIGAYHGLGAAGVYFYAPGELDLSELEPFWLKS